MVIGGEPVLKRVQVKLVVYFFIQKLEMPVVDYVLNKGIELEKSLVDYMKFERLFIYFIENKSEEKNYQKKVNYTKSESGFLE